MYAALRLSLAPSINSRTDPAGSAEMWWGETDGSTNANGLTVNTESISAVLAGGIGFGVADGNEPGQPAASGQRFRLFGEKRRAFAPDDGSVGR